MNGSNEKENMENSIPVDENGKVIEPEKKKGNWKGTAKKVLGAIACMVGGVIIFLAVGAAMVDNDSASSESHSDNNGGDTNTSSSNGAASESENETGKSAE